MNQEITWPLGNSRLGAGVLIVLGPVYRVYRCTGADVLIVLGAGVLTYWS